MMHLLEMVKKNLIIEHDEDDELIKEFIDSAVDYAEKYQHRVKGFYAVHPMSATTRQGVVILACHYYESRDGSTGGFFNDSTNAAKQIITTVNFLFRLDRDWKV